MKTKQRQSHGVVVLHGDQAKAVIKSIELSRGKKPMTVGEGIDLWISWMNRKSGTRSADQCSSYIRAWARATELLAMPLNDVNDTDIENWVNEEGIKLGTRRVRLSVIRSLFKFLSIKELLTVPDPSRLARIDFKTLSHKQKETREVKTYTAQEFERIVKYLDDALAELQPKIDNARSLVLKKLLKRREHLVFWRSAVVIGRCAGLRMGDICQLEWDCFGKKFAVWTDKRDKRVEPYIWNQELFDNIVSQITMDNAQYCFPTHRAIHLNTKERAALPTQFSRLLKQVGIKGHSFHGLRHTYATECDKAGIPRPHISASMGHSSSRTTAGYIHDD